MVAVSPTSATIGQPVEVLVRTFLPVDQRGLALPVESPVEPYPVPSGVWNVLYPWSDYPFDVVAQLSEGTEVDVKLARDPADATVWRGIAVFPKPGSWTIWLRNFQHKEVGSTAEVTVHGEPPSSSPAPAGSLARAPASIESGLAGLVGALLLGVLLGLVIGRIWNQRRPA